MGIYIVVNERMHKALFIYFADPATLSLLFFINENFSVNQSWFDGFCYNSGVASNNLVTETISK